MMDAVRHIRWEHERPCWRRDRAVGGRVPLPVGRVEVRGQWSKTGVKAQREFRQHRGLHEGPQQTLADLLTASSQLATPTTSG